MTTATGPRTRRSPDNVWATGGAVDQHDGKLPIYICNACGREVVWATSKRTGRKYLANIQRGANGWRYYVGANVHRCDQPVAVDEADIDAQYDDWAADQYVQTTVRASWADRQPTGDVDRGAYYDTTTYVVSLPAGVTADAYRKVIAAGDGQSMASYGIFGGYSTIGTVTDRGDGTALVTSVYHIGD